MKNNKTYKIFVIILIVLLISMQFSSALDLSFNKNSFDFNLNHLLYTGKEKDSTGLYYYGARYYDPSVFTFITPDQNIPNLYNSQDLNRYTYVRNNPYKYVDPDGNFAFVPLLIAAGGGAAISAGINIVAQYSQTGSVNWANVGKSAGIGAVSGLTGFGAGSLVTSVFGSGAFAAVGGGAVSGFAGGEAAALTSSIISGEDYNFDPTRALTNTAIGGLAGGIGYKAGSISKTNFASKEALASHFEKHGAEFGFTSEKQYLQAAQKFISGKGNDLERYTRNNGEVVIVNKITGELGIRTKRGNIKTYFDPGKGNPTKSYEYFLRDKQKNLGGNK